MNKKELRKQVEGLQQELQEKILRIKGVEQDYAYLFEHYDRVTGKLAKLEKQFEEKENIWKRVLEQVG